MATNASDARLKFLKQAAYQLSTSAPAVSAALTTDYFQSVINSEDDLQHAKKDWEILRREACGACGNAMLPGWSSTVTSASRRTMVKKSQSTLPKSSEKKLMFTCLRCDRKSVQLLQARSPKHVSSKSARPKVDTTKSVEVGRLGGEEQDKISKTANATSKQRKKSRKGGLQAMLEKNKCQSSGQGGLGLDLMDFMQ